MVVEVASSETGRWHNNGYFSGACPCDPVECDYFRIGVTLQNARTSSSMSGIPSDRGTGLIGQMRNSKAGLRAGPR